MAKKLFPYAPQGTGGTREGAGRTLNSIKELCREYVLNDRLVEKLVSIATTPTMRTQDSIRAIEILMDRGFGKAEQSVELTTHDADRPTTDTLIETIRALREQLDVAREGIGVAKAE